MALVEPVATCSLLASAQVWAAGFDPCGLRPQQIEFRALRIDLLTPWVAFIRGEAAAL
jgi:hypothetical protein